MGLFNYCELHGTVCDIDYVWEYARVEGILEQKGVRLKGYCSRWLSVLTDIVVYYCQIKGILEKRAARLHGISSRNCQINEILV